MEGKKINSPYATRPHGKFPIQLPIQFLWQVLFHMLLLRFGVQLREQSRDVNIVFRSGPKMRDATVLASGAEVKLTQSGAPAGLWDTLKRGVTHC